MDLTFIATKPFGRTISKVLKAWRVELVRRRRIKRKPPPRSNDPPSEAIIIYDESSSPGVDDYLIDADYPIEAYI